MAAVYQSMVSPGLGVASNLTNPTPHLLVLTTNGTAGKAVILAITAVLAEKQPAVDLDAT